VANTSLAPSCTLLGSPSFHRHQCLSGQHISCSSLPLAPSWDLPSFSVVLTVDISGRFTVHPIKGHSMIPSMFFFARVQDRTKLVRWLTEPIRQSPFFIVSHLFSPLSKSHCLFSSCHTCFLPFRNPFAVQQCPFSSCHTCFHRVTLAFTLLRSHCLFSSCHTCFLPFGNPFTVLALSTSKDTWACCLVRAPLSSSWWLASLTDTWACCLVRAVLSSSLWLASLTEMLVHGCVYFTMVVGVVGFSFLFFAARPGFPMGGEKTSLRRSKKVHGEKNKPETIEKGQWP
jgi:hypothetical protein